MRPLQLQVTGALQSHPNCQQKTESQTKNKMHLRPGSTPGTSVGANGTPTNPRSFAANGKGKEKIIEGKGCLLYTSPSPRDGLLSRMPSSA